MSLKIKKMLIALALMAAIPFTCGSACDEENTTSAPSGSDWFRCASVTCTYKVKLNGTTRNAVAGVQINRATATPLEGKWVRK